MLLAECDAGGVQRWQPCSLAAVRHGATAEAPAMLDTAPGMVQTRSVVVATGGLSIPKIGATDFGYRLARQFGLRMVERARPGAADLRRRGWAPYAHWPGCRCRCSIATGTGKRRGPFDEDLLFTHRGLSRPGGAADLQLLAAGHADLR
jgi:predicted flavoprotein YhiN